MLVKTCQSSQMSPIVCRPISDTGVIGWFVDICLRLGQNIRRLRQSKGWSQEDYADRAEIHRTYVSDIERGRRNPSLTVIERLAKPFEIAPGRLLD